MVSTAPVTGLPSIRGWGWKWDLISFLPLVVQYLLFTSGTGICSLLDAANGTFSGELPQELQMYKNDIDLTRLKVQLQMMPDLIRTRNQLPTNLVPIKKVTNVRTICDVMNDVSVSKDMLSQVHRLLKIFYTIPVTSSTAERTFSALRRLNTFLRSTMTQPRLNHAMLLYVHKERTDQLNINIIARSFVDQNEWRRQYFGCV